jgi:hypothetical protein
VSHRDADDPRCPECGEPIGATATYCMHCSADLTAERARADATGDGFWDESADPAGAAAGDATVADDEYLLDPSAGDGQLLDPDGFADNALTAAVGLGGGLVVGVVGTLVLLLLTGSGWAAAFGVVAWLAATAHLVTRRTVQEAFARTAYGVAVVLLLVPLVAFGPTDGGTDLGTRVALFVTMLGAVAIPAAVAASVGFAVSRYLPGAGSDE